MRSAVLSTANLFLTMSRDRCRRRSSEPRRWKCATYSKCWMPSNSARRTRPPAKVAVASKRSLPPPQEENDVSALTMQWPARIDTASWSRRDRRRCILPFSKRRRRGHQRQSRGRNWAHRSERRIWLCCVAEHVPRTLAVVPGDVPAAPLQKAAWVVSGPRKLRSSFPGLPGIHRLRKAADSSIKGTTCLALNESRWTTPPSRALRASAPLTRKP